MSAALLFGLFLAALVLFIVAEGVRQRRRQPSKSTGPALMRTGMLELQSMLEPDRKIEMLVKDEDATVQEAAGAPPSSPPSRRPKR